MSRRVCSHHIDSPDPVACSSDEPCTVARLKTSHADLLAALRDTADRCERAASAIAGTVQLAAIDRASRETICAETDGIKDVVRLVARAAIEKARKE